MRRFTCNTRSSKTVVCSTTTLALGIPSTSTCSSVSSMTTTSKHNNNNYSACFRSSRMNNNIINNFTNSSYCMMPIKQISSKRNQASLSGDEPPPPPSSSSGTKVNTDAHHPNLQKAAASSSSATTNLKSSPQIQLQDQHPPHHHGAEEHQEHQDHQDHPQSLVPTDEASFDYEAALKNLTPEELHQLQQIQTPIHPDDLVPAYIKLNKGAKLVKFKEDSPDDLVQLNQHVAFPPPPEHPWIEGQPWSNDFAHIQHGDGQLRVVGTGEVGFDNERREYPQTWRGLQPRFLVGLHLPHTNGTVNDNLIVKYSLDRTGRGLFATRDIKKGEVLMVVKSTATSLGYVPRTERLLDMMRDILLRVHRRCIASKASGKEHEHEEELEYLHTWIMQGQQSSLVEGWTSDQTERLIKRLGGRHVLDDLQLHALHIARLAAVIDMNSFVVEGYYNEDRGKGYWPEAGLFNHSCAPNSEYEVMNEDTFKISDYNEEFVRAKQKFEEQEAAANFFKENENNNNNNVSESTTKNQQQQQEGSASTEQQKEEELELQPLKQQQQQQTKRELMFMEQNPEFGIQNEENPESYTNPETYLFCCKANRDIAQGEELLISYVPSEWRYENRQNVLHERYRFWCRCSKCSPTVDAHSKFYARCVMFICMVFLILQLWVYTVRENSIEGQERADRGDIFPHSHWYEAEGEEPEVDVIRQDGNIEKNKEKQQEAQPQ